MHAWTKNEVGIFGYITLLEVCFLSYLFWLFIKDDRTLLRQSLARAKGLLSETHALLSRGVNCVRFFCGDSSLPKQVEHQIIQIRIHAFRRLFGAFLIFELAVMVNVQVNILYDFPRIMTDEVIFATLVVCSLALLMTVFPSLVSLKTLDLWSSTIMLSGLFYLTPLVSWTASSRLQWSSMVLIGRVIVGFAGHRMTVVFFWQTIYMLLAIWDFDTHSVASQTTVRAEVLSCLFVLVMIAGLRLALAYKLKVDIQNQLTRNELGAASSLLGIMCDAVVSLDEHLRLIEHSPQLAILLMHRGSSCLEGQEFQQFLASSDDKERVISHLRGQNEGKVSDANVTPELGFNLGTGPITSAFHADLKDAFGTTIKAEFFHVVFAGLDGAVNHLLGMREYTDTIPWVRKETDQPVSELSVESSQDSTYMDEIVSLAEDSSSMTRPTAIFDAYMEMLGRTPAFEKITSCAKRTMLEHLLVPTSARYQVIKQISDEVNSLINDDNDEGGARLKFDGDLVVNKLATQDINIQSLHVRICKDKTLGTVHDIAIVVTLHLFASASTACLSETSSRRRKSGTPGVGTRRSICPDGSFSNTLMSL